jgi:hypothetical protein
MPTVVSTSKTEDSPTGQGQGSRVDGLEVLNEMIVTTLGVRLALCGGCIVLIHLATGVRVSSANNYEFSVGGCSTSLNTYGITCPAD